MIPSNRKELSRRDFLSRGLCVTTGAVAATALTSCDSLKTAETENSAAWTRFGFTTYQWGKDWDVPTLIANCSKAGVFGVELRTSQSYAHGVELELDARQRREVKKRFEDSPVCLVGIASGERYDSPEKTELNSAIENLARPRASPLAATKRLKVGSCGSGELFFAFAFLFTASISCEGGEKRTTAKNKRLIVPL